MTLHIHNLRGCRAVPLAHYLKALGVLRLVSEQADQSARGWWEDESFRLASRLDAPELLAFFLNDYRPTPVVAPWNGGSGFYPKDNCTGLDAIAQSKAPRFAAYRDAIAIGRELTAGRSERLKDDAKESLLRLCRRTWRGDMLCWLDAALVLSNDGSPDYPALLGTGGNDGRLDFTNNFMQRLTELFDCTDSLAPALSFAAALLDSSLFGRAAPGLVQGKAVGQFLPGGVGDRANGTAGFKAESLVNPWDFVLMLEGTILFAASLTRRSLNTGLPQASAPFSVRSTAAGYGSTALADEGARGEQWMPLWDRPATAAELRVLIAEGRSQVHDRPAQRPVDFARAIARLGVARGITVFERFGYIERNGQANLATPLGRWRVEAQPHQDLIDQIEPWIDRLRRAGLEKHAPASLLRAVRNCEEAILGCCRTGQSPRRWQDLLLALGEAEEQLAASPQFTADKHLQPLRHLSAAWVRAADDGCPELRLALSLALQIGARGPGTLDYRNTVRRHYLPLDEGGRFRSGANGLVVDSGVVCRTGDLQRDALALVRRRLVEAGQEGMVAMPLVGLPDTEASLSDVVAFLCGDVDDARILGLARPLMALDRSKRVPYPPRSPMSSGQAGILSLYGLVRLAHAPWPIKLPGGSAIAVRLDPAIMARLVAGDLTLAIALAARRLRASGLRPHFDKAAATPAFTVRLAASLAFPISARDGAFLAERLSRPTMDSTGDEDTMANVPGADPRQ